ncbi:hypothetical protein HBNCFIEN_02326 [Legionella sp. PC997]|nr:hypothetical protein HBNCFIEN_02326 [Legionella sp. PC997]
MVAKAGKNLKNSRKIKIKIKPKEHVIVKSTPKLIKKNAENYNLS